MSLKTIENNSKIENVINKSKFIAYSFALKSFEEIENYLNYLKTEFSDSTHICYAYKFLSGEKCVDDGEPQGTAGKPILDCIKKQDLSNVLVVVVRYFGGIKLGAGGLTRAYSAAARDVLSISGYKNIFECKKIEFNLPICENKKLGFLNNLKLLNLQFSYLENIKVEFFCPIEDVENTCEKLNNLFGKKIQFITSDQAYFV